MLSERTMLILASALMCAAAVAFIALASWSYIQDVNFYWQSKPVVVLIERVTVDTEVQELQKGQQINRTVTLQARYGGERRYLSATYVGNSPEDLDELRRLQSSQGKQITIWMIPGSSSVYFSMEHSFPSYRLVDVLLPITFLIVCVIGATKTLRRSK